MSRSHCSGLPDRTTLRHTTSEVHDDPVADGDGHQLPGPGGPGLGPRRDPEQCDLAVTAEPNGSGVSHWCFLSASEGFCLSQPLMSTSIQSCLVLGKSGLTGVNAKQLGVLDHTTHCVLHCSQAVRAPNCDKCHCGMFIGGRHQRLSLLCRCPGPPPVGSLASRIPRLAWLLVHSPPGLAGNVFLLDRGSDSPLTWAQYAPMVGVEVCHVE